MASRAAVSGTPNGKAWRQRITEGFRWACRRIHAWFVAPGAGPLLARLIVAVLSIVAAVALGAWVPYLLQDPIRAMPSAGLALGGAALLGVLKRMVESLPNMSQFVTRAQAGILPVVFAQVAVGALGLGFAFFATESTPAVRALNLNVDGTLPPLVISEGDAPLTAMVVFKEGESTLHDDAAQVALVSNLVRALAGCLRAEDDTVTLVVRAYASSSGLDAANEALAHERAQFVVGSIQEEVQALARHGRARFSESQFSIQRPAWRSVAVMKSRRLFHDRDERDFYLEDAGALNRRAEIKVREAGSCFSS